MWMWCCVGCVRFGCEGWCVCEVVLVAFWGVGAGVLGGCGACGVCSRLLERADVRLVELPLRKQRIQRELEVGEQRRSEGVAFAQHLHLQRRRVAMHFLALRENRPCLSDSVSNRCTLIRP